MMSGMTNMQLRFAEELRTLLDAGRGTESVDLVVQGSLLDLYPSDDSLEPWLNTAIGSDATRQLVTLFAVSPCAFCRRGLERCADCDGHGHFDYAEVCEQCLGLGICRCDFCNGSGLASIEATPAGLRIPVAIERASSALQQIESLSNRLSSDAAVANPRDALKEQASLILRLNGLLGILENEIGEESQNAWWTPQSTRAVTQLVKDWPKIGRSAEERICAAFQSMSETAAQMVRDTVDGSNVHSLAIARADYYERFTTPDSLDRTDVDHPILDRIMEELGVGEPRPAG